MKTIATLLAMTLSMSASLANINFFKFTDVEGNIRYAQTDSMHWGSMSNIPMLIEGESDATLDSIYSAMTADSILHDSSLSGGACRVLFPIGSLNPKVSFNLNRISGTYNIYAVTYSPKLPTTFRGTIYRNGKSYKSSYNLTTRVGIDTLQLFKEVIIPADFDTDITSNSTKSLSLEIAPRVTSSQMNAGTYTKTISIDCILLEPVVASGTEDAATNPGLKLYTADRLTHMIEKNTIKEISFHTINIQKPQMSGDFTNLTVNGEINGLDVFGEDCEFGIQIEKFSGIDQSSSSKFYKYYGTIPATEDNTEIQKAGRKMDYTLHLPLLLPEEEITYSVYVKTKVGTYYSEPDTYSIPAIDPSLVNMTAEQQKNTFYIIATIDARPLVEKIESNTYQTDNQYYDFRLCANEADAFETQQHGIYQTQISCFDRDNGIYTIKPELAISLASETRYKYPIDIEQQVSYVKPDDKELENILPNLMIKDANISLFVQALQATGLMEKLYAYYDKNYVRPENDWYDYITGGNIHESALYPNYRWIGHTVFALSNSVLSQLGINTMAQMKDYAHTLYPEAANDENYEDPQNALYQFLAYHILDCDIHDYNSLTARYNLGIETQLANPTDWYQTLLPHSLLKAELLTLPTIDESIRSKYCLNGVLDEDSRNLVQGSCIDPETQLQGLNGICLYIDAPIAYDAKTKNAVFNTRMRIDFSTIFSELITNDYRMNGDYTKDDDSYWYTYDHTCRNGVNVAFAPGFLHNETHASNTHLVYRRPRQSYWSANGDEYILQGYKDITINLPAVATTGKYQIRLGYAGMPRRCKAQIYIDGVLVNDNYDMTKSLTDVLGYQWKPSGWTTENLQESINLLREKGYYPGPKTIYCVPYENNKYNFFDNLNIVRQVVATLPITAGETHTMTIKYHPDCDPNDGELILDYIEIVPESVYDNAENPEDLN